MEHSALDLFTLCAKMKSPNFSVGSRGLIENSQGQCKQLVVLDSVQSVCAGPVAGR